MLLSFLNSNKLERGSAAIMALVVITVLLTVGSGLMTRSRTESEIMSNYTDGVSAQYLAEAGIQHARAEVIVQEYNENIDNSKLRNISLGNGSYDAVVTLVDRFHYSVISTGRVNNASRKLEAVMEKQLPPTEDGLRIIRCINKVKEDY
jgi:Tfp pilus assembly protein PilX